LVCEPPELDGRKCLLLTHAGTLFTIFGSDVRAAQLRATRQLLTQLIEWELLGEGLPISAFGTLHDETLMIDRTADRRLLGCMNDMTFHCEHAIAVAGSLAVITLRLLNLQLHRNTNSSRAYERPIDLMSERISRQLCRYLGTGHERRTNIGTHRSFSHERELRPRLDT
jgi:hypothetical protein